MKPQWTYLAETEFYKSYEASISRIGLDSPTAEHAHLALQRQIQGILKARLLAIGLVEWPTETGDGDFSVTDEFENARLASLAAYSRRAHSPDLVSILLDVLLLDSFHNWCIHLACEPEQQTLGELFVLRGKVTALLVNEFTYEWFCPPTLKPWYNK